MALAVWARQESVRIGLDRAESAVGDDGREPQPALAVGQFDEEILRWQAL
jgi:hypothetical protein